MVNNSENIDIFEVKKHKALKPRTKNAKAAGVKSTFVVENSIVMTAFEKGNKAIVEKEIKDGQITNLNDKPRFDVKPAKNCFEVKGNGKISAAYTAQHSEGNVGKDLIGCKSRLEKRYFGREFNDNIHIQLIYNILDIEKILTIHINDIVYSLDNLQRKDGFEDKDFIGFMSLRSSYDDFCDPASKYQNNKELHKVFEEYKNNPRLKYFDCITFDEKKRIDEKKLYYMLAMLGEVRQFCAHSKEVDALYNLENDLNDEAKAILDELYKEKIHSVNNGFVKNNGKNISILFDVLNAKGENEKEQIVKQFYDFVMRKSFKNMGFSIKKLREQMIDANDEDIKHTRFDSMRSKFYTLLDFIIYVYYVKNPDCAESNLNKLRACTNDNEKDMVYVKEADRLWNFVQSTVKQIKREMTPRNIRDQFISKEDRSILGRVTRNVELKADVNYFCKAIYLMTRFMDGKEINDLLTTLINKFENIASFIDVMEKCEIPYDFKGNSKRNFKMFEDSKKIAGWLREINSFARMSAASADAKQILYIEAAKLLGVDEDDDALVDYLQENLLGKHILKGKHDFRNFIASNVIESSRFRYLVKYANPEKVRFVANNKKVVSFVLDKMPDTQIDRYYNSCTGKNNDDRNAKIEKLAEIIGNMNFKDFSSVKMNVRGDNSAAMEKQKKQASISLYLTVLYLLVKNLVYVNARYFLAFHCYERDARLHGLNPNNKVENWCNLTEKSVAEKRQDVNQWFDKLENPNRNQSKRKWRIERSCSYLETNMSNIDNETITAYRNNIDHLNPIRNIDMFIDGAKEFNSYFELYHYLMQRSIEQSAKHFEVSLNHPKVVEYLKAVNLRGTYCKDFVKALNAPFGYNLPRFKNLSIDVLFDMHNQPMATKEADKK